MFALKIRPVLTCCLMLFPLLAILPGAQAKPFIDDLGRTVDVPATPKRIISLYDVDITVPLIELGIIPIASHGRMGLNGKPYLRTSKLLTGVDFDTDNIRYIGSTEIDLEAIAALKPDLIITSPIRTTPIEPLQYLAPTVSLDASMHGTRHIYRKLAQLTGTQNRLRALETRYQAGIDALKSTIQTGSITVNVFQPLNGKISVYHTYRSLGRVLRDAGFKFPALTDNIPVGERIDVGAEYLPDLDADFIFDPYRADRGDGAAQERAAMEKVFPGFCQFLRACQNGRYILVSREVAISSTYSALALMTSLVQSHVASHLEFAAPHSAKP